MKKSILLFTAICVIMLSCKKDKPAKPGNQDGKLYPVTFNVSGFTQTQEPAITPTNVRLAADTPLKSIMTRIAYRLYTPEGVLLRDLRGKYTDKDFGRFTDSLAVGNYTVLFLGYADTASDNFIGIPPDDIFTFTGRRLDSFEDILYYKKFNFTVPAATQNVALERVNAALQVVIKDAKPSNVTTIHVNYEDYNGFYAFKNLPTWNWDFEHPENNNEYITIRHSFSTTITAPTGTTNFATIVWPYILNTVTPMDVTITATGPNSVVASKIAHNVMFYRNTKTILTGKLFSNDPIDVGFKTTFKTDFEADSIIKTF